MNISAHGKYRPILIKKDIRVSKLKIISTNKSLNPGFGIANYYAWKQESIIDQILPNQQ